MQAMSWQPPGIVGPFPPGLVQPMPTMPPPLQQQQPQQQQDQQSCQAYAASCSTPSSAPNKAGHLGSGHCQEGGQLQCQGTDQGQCPGYPANQAPTRCAGGTSPRQSHDGAALKAPGSQAASQAPGPGLGTNMMQSAGTGPGPPPLPPLGAFPQSFPQSFNPFLPAPRAEKAPLVGSTHLSFARHM